MKLRSLPRAWNEWWFAPASPYPIAAFRVLLALYLLGYFGALAPHVSVLFSSAGVYAPYLIPDWAAPPVLAIGLYAALLALCVLLLVGYRAQWTIAALLALFAYHYLIALGVRHSAYDRLIAIFLLLLLPANGDAVWAVSAREPPVATVRFAGRMIRFQCIVLYLGAGLWKAINPVWRSGELLHSTLQSVWSTPLGFSLVRLQPAGPFWQGVSWLVIGFELSLGLLLWVPASRLIGVVAAVSFHALNTLVIAVPEFLVCIPPMVFFLPEDAVRRVGARAMAFVRSSAAGFWGRQAPRLR